VVGLPVDVTGLLALHAASAGAGPGPRARGEGPCRGCRRPIREHPVPAGRRPPPPARAGCQGGAPGQNPGGV